MINFNNVNLQFSNMGLFNTTDTWLHPTRVIDSYELIYVMDGEFDIVEDENVYHLQPQSILFLSPHHEHKGLKRTNIPIKFYWLHFYCDGFENLKLKKLYTNSQLNKESYFFQELMSAQYSNNKLLCDIKLAEILIKLNSIENEQHPKLVYELMEYIRLNIEKNLSVSAICDHFGYSPDQCAKLFKKALGITLHTFITKQRIKFIKNLLLNTTLSIKEISDTANFEDENLFVKFFKYQTGITPSQYRNKHNGLHMNNH